MWGEFHREEFEEHRSLRSRAPQRASKGLMRSRATLCRPDRKMMISLCTNGLPNEVTTYHPLNEELMP